MSINSLKKIKSFKNKIVLLRVDFNVPLTKGKIADDAKIEASLPTLRYLLKQGAKVVLISHLGRPQGKKNKKDSLKIILKHLQNKYHLQPLFLTFDVIKQTERLQTIIAQQAAGSLMLLENIRFYKEEEINSVSLAKKLASLGDIYVNDAFGVCHRKNASVAAITKFIPSFAGLLLEREITHLQRMLRPQLPAVAVMGGIKMETKLPAVGHFAAKYNKVLLGVGMAKVFWQALGTQYGKKDVLFSDKEVRLAKKFYKKYASKIMLPQDVIVGNGLSAKTKAVYKKIGEVTKSDVILDIGPETIKKYASVIKRSQTIVWNGPLGWFQVKAFSHGSIAVARVIGWRSKGKAFGIVGGGETLACLRQAKVEEYIDFVSTGGGAMLEYLINPRLPALIALGKF